MVVMVMFGVVTETLEHKINAVEPGRYRVSGRDGTGLSTGLSTGSTDLVY